MADRCTGRCCKEIHQPHSPGQLAAAAEAAYRGEPMYVWDGEARWALGDAIKLNSMLTLIREEGPGHWVYTCRHLLPNGDCGDYENRPYMCRAFPYGKPCPYPDCTWDEARHGGAGI